MGQNYYNLHMSSHVLLASDVELTEKGFCLLLIITKYLRMSKVTLKV
jgi:hypothetical protein